jgi:hypothetical protein
VFDIRRHAPDAENADQPDDDRNDGNKAEADADFKAE